MNVRAYLEHRMQSSFLGGILVASVIGSGCVPGPALQRAFTQHGTVNQQDPPPYAQATVVPEVTPHRSERSREENLGAGILQGIGAAFGIRGNYLAATAFDIAGDVERGNAIISGQKEAAEIIREGLQPNGTSRVRHTIPDGVERVRLQEFGLVEFIIAPQYTDLNGNGRPERTELHPSTHITTKSGLWIASSLFDQFTVYKPMIKLFQEDGTPLLEEEVTNGRIRYWYIGNPHNQAPPGKYRVAFFGQVPIPGPWEQRSYGKQGVFYLMHSMSFEVVEEK